MTSLDGEFPLSVEEAGALLGATITRCGKETFPLIAPPKGMHSSFATTLPVPSAEILNRLYDLRALLRSSPTDAPLSAAPSLLAVLMKLVGVSTSLAAANLPTNTHVRRLETPPLLSVPLRNLWVDCVVLCHVRGEGLTGTAKIDTTQFVRRMLALASTNPRSAKAAGGVRVAGLEVVAGLLKYETSQRIASQLAPWTLDILQVTLKALRSAGNGEPSYRVAAVRMASAASLACRQASLKTRGLEGNQRLVIQGGMEDKAIHEALKILKQAMGDKFPEVRGAAAKFASILPPFLFLTSGGPDNTLSCMDEVVQIAIKNLDDEIPFVAEGWADSLARCLSTILQYHEQTKSLGQSDGGRDEETTGTQRSATETDAASRFGSRKSPGTSASLSTVKKAIAFLVDQFVKAGGELVAVRAGGTYSVGGRAVRMGYTLALTQFMGLQYEIGSVGEGRAMSLREALLAILSIAGSETEKQLKPPAIEPTTSVNPLFGSSRTWSKSDAVLVKISISRILRRGLSEIAPESVQLLILQSITEIMGSSAAREQGSAAASMNALQTQVLLVEISHLCAALGAAAASKTAEIMECLKSRLLHVDSGVRHEAAVACTSLATAFPSVGKKLLWTSLEDMQQHYAQLVTAASNKEEKSSEEASGNRFFRRATKEAAVDLTLPHQSAIHGFSLMVALVIKELPQLPGGLPYQLLSTALSAAEILVSSRNNSILCSTNASCMCTCVRAGFTIISGVLACGPRAAEANMTLIFKAWTTTCNLASTGGKGVGLKHDLICMDALLSSTVVFLKYDTALLLSIPEALSQITLLLENAVKLFGTRGKFQNIQGSSAIITTLESAKASLLEAFAWLPSGSFPMAADDVFSLAGRQIKEAIESDVTCSILPSLVSSEDSVLDAKPFYRAKLDGQVGGALGQEETLSTLHAEAAQDRERESICLLLDDADYCMQNELPFKGSTILGSLVKTCGTDSPPTPLHEVGSWRKPIHPSCASKVRLADAAIQAFATTFGLKSGQEQQEAMDMLESLVPPLLMQLARSLGINAALTEQNVRSKAKEDSAAVENITAVLLSCLQALPLHESTHNIPLGLGPPWMNKAKEILLTLLPSPSTIVRRASAEGLALLATVGVSEDAHFLQSAVLHSLDEVMQGNKPDGKPRAMSLDSVSAARAGSLLTLAFIQRTNYEVTQRKHDRAISRGSDGTSEQRRRENGLPVFQMITRILPSVACHGTRDYFTVRTCAIHSYAVLVAYSQRLDKMNPESMQLLRKGVEIIEENFTSVWTIASVDEDRGQEAEKMVAEASFLAILLRFMTCFVPHVKHLLDENRSILRRFCVISSLILEAYGHHPAIFFEGMAFFEVMTSFRALLPTSARHVLYTENPIFSCLPSILRALEPDRPSVLYSAKPHYCSSKSSFWAAAQALFALSPLHAANTNLRLVPYILRSLDFTCGSRQFPHAETCRSLASYRGMTVSLTAAKREVTISSLLLSLLASERVNLKDDRDIYFRWLLFARTALAGPAKAKGLGNESRYSRTSVIDAANMRAASDLGFLETTFASLRWQVKQILLTLAFQSFVELRIYSLSTDDTSGPSLHFDAIAAETRLAATAKGDLDESRTPNSKLAFHLDELISCICMTCVATVDHSELFSIQELSTLFLNEIVKCFYNAMDPELPQTLILEQYLTQIISAVKHAISAKDHEPSTGSRRLFINGCRATLTMVQHSVVSDPMALKRLIRPLIPKVAPRFMLDDPYPSHCLPVLGEKESGDTRSALLPLIGQIWSCGSLLVLENEMSTQIKTICDELISDRTGMAIHAAAAAMDGARLLLRKSQTLAGLPLEEKYEQMEASFYLIDDPENFDLFTGRVLESKWASLAACALIPLIDHMTDEVDDAKLAVLRPWIDAMVSILLQGSINSVTALGCKKGDVDTPEPWVDLIDPSSILVDCLRGLCAVAKLDGQNILNDVQKVELTRVIDYLRRDVLSKCFYSKTNESLEKIVQQTCALLLALASTPVTVLLDEDPLLVAILLPLDHLQKETLQLTNDSAVEVAACSLECAASLIRTGRSSNDFVNAILHLLMDSIFSPPKSSGDLPEAIMAAALSLLYTCMECKSIPISRKSEIANSMVHTGNWRPWEVIASVDDGIAISMSLDIVNESLNDETNSDLQLAALSSIRNIMQSPKASETLIELLLNRTGAELATVLKSYGSHQRLDSTGTTSSEAVTDAMKCLLVAYQKLALKETEENISLFLGLFFEAQLAVLRSNGLPNHPVAMAAAKPALGRMCAQSILHIAKTTPVPFKQAVAALAEHDRALLEFAVRAEMTGYATANQSQEKKKLNLKSFKK